MKKLMFYIELIVKNSVLPVLRSKGLIKMEEKLKLDYFKMSIISLQ
jgi:hypothetical protein